MGATGGVWTFSLVRGLHSSGWGGLWHTPPPFYFQIVETPPPAWGGGIRHTPPPLWPDQTPPDHFWESLQNDRSPGTLMHGPEKSVCNNAQFPHLRRGVSGIPPLPFIFKSRRPPLHGGGGVCARPPFDHGQIAGAGKGTLFRRYPGTFWNCRARDRIALCRPGWGGMRETPLQLFFGGGGSE